MAGTVAARAGNGLGVASTAHDAGVQPVRVLGACGGGKSDTIEAIVWAAGGTVPGVPANKTPAKVINLGLGEKAPYSDAYQQAIDSAVRRGTTVVVAAGNDDAHADAYTPANCDRVSPSPPGQPRLVLQIKATARPITGCGDNCGAGLADAGAAVRSLTAAADRDTVAAGRGLPARS
ncbi:hypothetical protein Srubr_23960 [Streptomyces rubradiris]|uniref:Peptidase S8/S53 domain-containing protein n=1 Tax=Streptomyces rubradiris TaxID=285531 RepID=A0ABQ3R9P1_STRRR|nr:hypothetical protein GCM10018792_14510 [Streptomyces rubradiris]GHI52550.1 hypothetical protein Srubr_23960 [Streptomyces rubradiris]